MSGKTVHVLVVEDDSVDRETIERTFRKMNIRNPHHFATDGLDALNALRGRRGRPPVPRPYLVLLDLSMPRMSGLEFLEEIREDPELGDSVIFVLTTSKEDRDIVASYEKNIAGYIVKPRAGEEFESMVEMLGRYWSSIEFPPERQHV